MKLFPSCYQQCLDSFVGATNVGFILQCFPSWILLIYELCSSWLQCTPLWWLTSVAQQLLRQSQCKLDESGGISDPVLWGCRRYSDTKHYYRILYGVLLCSYSTDCIHVNKIHRVMVVFHCLLSVER